MAADRKTKKVKLNWAEKIFQSYFKIQLLKKPNHRFLVVYNRLYEGLFVRRYFPNPEFFLRDLSFIIKGGYRLMVVKLETRVGRSNRKIVSHCLQGGDCSDGGDSCGGDSGWRQ